MKEVDLAVQALSHYPEQTNSFKMEVGIEDCLHIEFEYNKSRSVRLSRRIVVKEDGCQGRWFSRRMVVKKNGWLSRKMVGIVHNQYSHLIRYDLRDVIVGKIYFLLVRIKIQHMEIQVIKRETTGSGAWEVLLLLLS